MQMELDAHTLYIIRKHRDLAHLYGEAPAAIETAIAGFQKQVAVADTHLTNHPFLVGDQFTAADLLMAVCIAWAKTYEVPVSSRLSDYQQAAAERPAYKTAAELNFSISPG